MHRQVGAEFDAEALLEVVVQFFREHGLPALLTFDNDPRFVGSSSGRDFPSALVHFLLCLGVEPNIIPPHRPDLNALLEGQDDPERLAELARGRMRGKREELA